MDMFISFSRWTEYITSERVHRLTTDCEDFPKTTPDRTVHRSPLSTCRFAVMMGPPVSNQASGKV